MIVVEGTLYPLLTRLKNDKLLKYEWQESTQGPPRKYYALTMDGEEALKQLDESWNELAYTVAVLRNPACSPGADYTSGANINTELSGTHTSEVSLTEAPVYSN